MAPELAARFPAIKTYAGQGLDDPTQAMRFDVTPQGLHAVVLGGSDIAFTILPTAPGQTRYAVVSARTADFSKGFPCEALPAAPKAGAAPGRAASIPVGSQLRRYRIAIAATAEFTNSPNLGGGVTMVSATAPAGNAFDLGVFCHELGHQCGADHAFNGTTREGCQRNRNPATAWEVGSGSTIMAYPGVCDADNIVTGFDLRFNAGSLGQMASYLATGDGASCASLVATGNALTYAWEQLDAGGNFVNPPYGDQPSDPPTTTRPLFRHYPPTASPTRLFPSLPFILNNANAPPPVIGGLRTGESLPSVTRALRFRVTARDNRAGGGGVNQAELTVNVVGAAGPFRVDNLAGTWPAGSQQAVSWAVAGASQPPINCSAVNIALSYDGGNTFVTVAAGVPNAGAATIVVPPEAPATTQARLKIEAANGAGVTGGNTFFDITDADFAISAASGCAYSLAPTSVNAPAGGASGASGAASVTAGAGCAWTATSHVSWATITGGASGSGNGTVSYAVAANPGPARSGTLTIAGQSLAIHQAPLSRATTIGMFRPANGFFYLRFTNAPCFADRDFFYGLADDAPVIGDWNGDGVETIGVFRNGQFFLRNSNAPGLPDIVAAFGSAGDAPLAGDWNGDGRDTIGAFRVTGQSAQFFLSEANASGPLPAPINYGLASDRPVVGKWQ